MPARQIIEALDEETPPQDAEGEPCEEAVGRLRRRTNLLLSPAPRSKHQPPLAARIAASAGKGGL